MRKFDGWTRRNDRGPVGDRRTVVRGSRLVRRPDLPQHGARLRHHVGNPEAAADLDELPARDDHFASFRQCREHDQRRRRVVVDDDCGLGAGDAAQQRFRVPIASAAHAAFQVVLERRIAARDRGDPVDGGRRQRRASQVGVDDDAGRVDDGHQRWTKKRAARRAAAASSRRAATAPASTFPGVPPAMARRNSAAATRRASTVASAPNRGLERPHAGALAQLFNRRNHVEVRHRRNGMLSALPANKPMTSDPPRYRPLERFWPYAELPEQPTAEELAALDPELQEALFGAQKRPFSITLVFPALDVPDFSRALDLARASAEFREIGEGDARGTIARASGRATPRACAISFRLSAAPTRPRCSSTIGPCPTPASCGCRWSGC